MSAPLQTLVEELLAAIEPLVEAADDPGMMANLLDSLGANDPQLVGSNLTTGLRALGQSIQDVRSIIAAPDLSLATANSALDGVRNIVAALTALSASGGSAYSDLGADLINLALTNRLRHGSPLLFQLFGALGLVQRNVLPPISIAGQVVRLPRPIDQLVLSNFGTLLSDPIALIRSELPTPLLSTVANAQLTADVAVERLGGMLRALGISWHYGFDAGDEAYLGDAIGSASRTIVLYVPFRMAAGAVAGLCITVSSADTDDLGIVLTPFGALNLQSVAGAWTIGIELSANIGSIAFGGGKGRQILAAVDPGEMHASVKAALGSTSAATASRIGSATGTRLELGQPEASVGLRATPNAVSLQVAAATGASALVIARGDGDSFLDEIIPADGVRAKFDLGLAWANDTGLTFRGAVGLDAAFPANLAIGPVTLSAIHLALQAQVNGSVTAEVSSDIGAKLGPISVAVERLGLSTTVSFPSSGGNLGVADLALGIKPPKGVGLAIDAHGVLTGGGFLRYDAQQGLYSGVMQLSLHDSITLTAYGLIATKLPDGRPGWSLLVFITADGFRPIPLGFGLVLQSLGGMLGLHRTFDQAVLKAGLQSDMLATLLFPRDPVANASALLQALAAAFPAKRGSTLLGLLARITWFTPTLVTLDLALILEIGARERLLILGRVSALLPTTDNDLIRLTVDAVGVLDFDAGTLEADAVLIHSRLVHQFPITGTAAIRARWTGASSVVGAAADTASTFVLAAGGLNPRFAAPLGFPTLDRVAIALCSGNNPRLVCDAYFALTANTVQFGSRASLYAEAIGFSIAGDVGFDALVTVVPPHFIVDFHACMQLKRGSHNLFKVTIDGTLEGPLPLRIAARAKFEIFWFSFTVHFDFTLAGGASAAPVLPAVTLTPLVAAALADPANWRTARGAEVAHGVALRALPAGGALVLDPLGRLVVTQPVAPLNALRDVTTYGGAPVAGDRRFNLTAKLNLQVGTPVRAAFAPARYFRMSDDEKLSAPSFETFDAGVVLGDPTTHYAVAASVPASLAYAGKTLYPTPAAGAAAAPPPPPPPAPYTMSAGRLATHAASGAAARVPVRRVGRARFRHTAAVPAATLRTPAWRLVRAQDGAVAPVAGLRATPGTPTVPAAPDTTWSAVRDTLATLNRGGAAWLMVPAHELGA